MTSDAFVTSISHLPRTTIDIDASVLRELKGLAHREGKTLGQLVSELVAIALSRNSEQPERRPEFRWNAQPMGARVDLEDDEALHAALSDQ